MDIDEYAVAEKQQETAPLLLPKHNNYYIHVENDYY